ncbi:MAG: molybdenum cofactor biosynthesis protein MoaE, partial [Frankia sp.]|nr:molybdenum cofactor biosynthesis protein MoaE [Frankia sp.]
MDVVVTSPNGAPVDASTNAAPSVAQPAAGPERPLVLAELRDQPLSVDECLAAVALPQAGGTAVFVGTVRDHDAGRHVVELQYVAHPLAAQELLAVAREVAGLPATALFGAVGAGPASGDGGDVASGGGSAGGGSAGG